MSDLEQPVTEKVLVSALGDWVTTKDLAEYIGMPYPNLWTYVKRGILPSADLHIGNKPLWKKETIENWNFPEFKQRVKMN